MDIRSINGVTAFLYFIAVFFIIKGLLFKFTKERMLHRIYGMINDMLFLLSIAIAGCIIYTAFYGSKNSFLHSALYRLLPESAEHYIESAGIIVLSVLALITSYLVFMVFRPIIRLLESVVTRWTGYICGAAERWRRPIRKALGVSLELPGMAVSVIAAVMLIALINTCFPYGALNENTSESREYNYIYTHFVSKAAESRLGKEIPVLLWNTAGQFSRDAYGAYAIGNNHALSTIEYLRFRIETKSNAEIDNEAKSIVGSETDEEKKAFLLYKWIGSNIAYDMDKYNDILNNESYRDKFGAIPAYNTRKGVCEDYSDLYTAMARAVGLKVRVIVGQGYSYDQWSGHAWNEVYIPKYEAWIPLDTTWAVSGYYFNNNNFYDTHVKEAIAGEWD